MKLLNITQKGNVAEIYIYGDIVSHPWFEGEQSAASISQQIQQLAADEIHVHIDSYGGSVKEGWGMYNALRQHKAKVITYADGFVASAALYPYLAGEQRIASPVSAFFLHQVMGAAEGYADELREAADEIDMLTEIGIQAFVEVTGTDEATIRQLMDKETWLDPKKAKELGICTEICGGVTQKYHSQSARARVVQKLTAPVKQEKQPDKAENPIIKFFS